MSPGEPPAKRRYAVIDEAGRLVTRTSSMVAAHRASRRAKSLASTVEKNRADGADETSERFGEYTLRASQQGASWDVDAYLGEQWVGSAQFGEVRGPIALKGWDVKVEPDHRRRGLASAMYKFAQKSFKLPIQPGDFQTPEGEAFLKGREGKKPEGA